MDDKFVVKGRIVDEDNQHVTGLIVKTYDKEGKLLSAAYTDDDGLVTLDNDGAPNNMKVVRNSKVLIIKDLTESELVPGGVFDWGTITICKNPPAEWHITGTVKDQMSGNPIEGLLVIVQDVDTSLSGGPFYDPLGEDVTDINGKFNVWFNNAIFEREVTWIGEVYPDVKIVIKNDSGNLLYESVIDKNVNGLSHICPKYCKHKGKEYLIEIDYITSLINMVGPVDVVDINTSGRARYAGIDDRPFGANTTIGGRIWGTKVDKWKLLFAEGFVDSADSRFSGFGPSSALPSGFSLIAEGTDKIWDGPIFKWNTTGLNETHTIILMVWDQNGDEYHDTQLIFLDNTAISPSALISSPAPGSTINKEDGSIVEISGTASDEFFYRFDLHWVGPTQTELTTSNILYPAAGNHVPVMAGKLGEWNIGSIPAGAYCLRLHVCDRTILNDGHDVHNDWTWNTLIIS